MHQIIFIMAIALLAWVLPAQASIKEIKAYKEAYEGAKVKCIDCHTTEKPKKEDGEHELNEYGQSVIAIDAEPTVETYQKAGKIEDFKKKEKE